MKEYDLSDRKLKIAFVLAVVLIGWLCFNRAVTAHAQTTPANLSPGVQEAVKLSQAHMGDIVILSYPGLRSWHDLAGASLRPASIPSWQQLNFCVTFHALRGIFFTTPIQSD